jgi:hypothetical protein
LHGDSHNLNTVIELSPPSVDPPNQVVIAKADSGASSHYFMPQDTTALTNLHPTPFGPTVTLPDSTTTQANQAGSLSLHPILSTTAQKAHVLEGITNSSLISLGQLCDDNCIAILDKAKIQVYKNSICILAGSRNPCDGLWDIAVPTKHPSTSIVAVPQTIKTSQQANAIIRKDMTKSTLAQYLYGSCGSPVPSTWKRAIQNGNFITWPGIDSISVDKHLPKSIASTKSHLDQERKNLQSTKPVTETTDTNDSFFPDPDIPNVKTFSACAAIVPFVAKNRAYHDLTGRFPHRSSRGNEYLLIVYDYDSNSILHSPLKNKTASEIKRGWLSIHARLAKGGNQPKLYIMDNEASNELKQALAKNDLAYQLVPPHLHRRNAAERAIRTFKSHLLACLATCDPDFPISEWDRLLFQVELTLNLLRSSRVNPRLSAYAYLHGNFDFNKTPLAPFGTRVIVHLKPDQRPSWAYHGEEGWYVGPSMEHYRCVKCYIPATGRVRDVDTLEFFPKQFPFPAVTTEDYLKQAAADIISLLQNQNSALPSLEYGAPTQNALVQIATLLGRAATAPELPTIRQVVSADTNPLQVIHPAPNTPPEEVLPPTTMPTIPPAQTVPPLPRLSPPISPDTPVPRVSPRVPNSPKPSRLPVTPSRLPATSKTPPRAFLPRVSARFRTSKHPMSLRYQQGTTSQPATLQWQSLQHLEAMRIFQPQICHIYTAEGVKETIDTLLSGTNGKIWDTSLANEFGRLAQGNGDALAGTDTIDFIHRSDVPTDKKVTYGNFICDYRPLKSEPYRVRLTVGGDKLPYAEDAGSPAASLLETKLLLNSTISDAHKGARFLCADLKDHFLASPMKDPEFMRIKYKYFPATIRLQYNLEQFLAQDGYVYIKIKKGMYGLKQAAILAYKHLVNQLSHYGYSPCPYTTGLWQHTTRRTKFCLCVDDFGVKYFTNEDANHLLNSLRAHYKISVDWEGKDYCGLSITWNYPKQYVDISMPGYVTTTLAKLQHTNPARPQFAPHHWTQPAYGQKIQLAPIDDSPKLNKTDTTYVQSCVGSFLYYARAVDPTMLPAINEISASQSSPTVNTMNDCKMLMDYAATYPTAIIRYHASDMVLHIDSDAAYLVLPNARSRYAGHYFLSDNPPLPPANPNPKPNGPILTICKTIRNVMASAAEAETGGVYGNAQEAIACRISLLALAHPQPPTPLKTDNSTANSFVHANIKQRRSKTWDMRWNWLRDKETHRQLRIYWDKGQNNNADYFTKHHPPAHHLSMRPQYVLNAHKVSTLLLNLTVRPTVSPLRLPGARVCSSRDRYITVKT